MAKLRDKLLFDLLSLPTAPYRESLVSDFIQTLFKKSKVPYFLDPVGNIVVGVSTKKEYLALVGKKAAEPVRLFIAHMDHPGFHGKKWLNSHTLEVTWHGGTPVKYLEGAPVWIGTHRGFALKGEILTAKLKKSGLTAEKGTVRITGSYDGVPLDLATFKKTFKSPSMLFGGFLFRAPVWQEGDLLYTKAADDLVGTFAIASLALDLFNKGKKSGTPFLALLTRAEEVGWLGAIAHLDLGWLRSRKREVLAVSLETSRTLPGAEIGKGPIIRKGDRFTVFSPAHTRVFLDMAEKILKKKYQTRIMDGGSCEASAATIYGLPAIGVSIPLGNYHNTGFEGGPDSCGPAGPAPEFVHRQDVTGMVALCQGLMTPKLPWDKPWEKKLTLLKKSLKKAKRMF